MLVSLRDICHHSIGWVCKVSPAGSVHFFLGAVPMREEPVNDITRLGKSHGDMSNFRFPAGVIVVVFFPNHISGTLDGCAHDSLEIAFVLYESSDN